MEIVSIFNKYGRRSIKNNVTRSFGLLENFLAMQRAKMANKIISDKHRSGRVLDIGCGSFPIFLLTTKFLKKFGIEKNEAILKTPFKKIIFVNYDIEKGDVMPFEENFIDIVTMLAVFEHIEYKRWMTVLSNLYRILKPNGAFIMTVPSTWSYHLLRLMSVCGLVSRKEIEDHKTNLSSAEIIRKLKNANFKNIRSGYFEGFLNRWFVGEK